MDDQPHIVVVEDEAANAACYWITFRPAVTG